MKKLLSVMILALALSSCAVKTVSRSELFTPTAATLVNSKELTDMMYYGSDNEYDYFSRGFQRLRVAKSEDAIPSSARFTFNNWQGGKLYRECLTESVGNSLVEKLQNLLNGASASNPVVQPVTTPTQPTTQPYQPKTQTGQAIKNWLEQYKTTQQ
jgi:hypothetical protein